MAINYNAAIPLNMFLQKRAGSISLTAQQNIDQLIKSLFANSEQGFAYDINDLSTLFQDAAGTTPVTGAGQPVGLVLDKSKGLVLGNELVVNGDFSNGSTSWNLEPGWMLNNGSVTATNAADGTSVYQAATTVIGKFYKVTFTISNYVSGSAYPTLFNANNGPTFSANGTFTCIIRKVNTGINFVGIAASGSFSGTIDNISVKELAGNHAYQTQAAMRPLLQRNATTRAYYLAFDGTDDFLVTNSINFTATDKVSVIAGVRKLSDVNSAIVIEHGVAGVNNKAFTMSAPDGNNLSNYSASLRNTSRATVFLNNKASPRSSVLSVKLNYTGATITDQVKMIENATPAPPSTDGSLLTATNFNDAPIYIGRRGGTSLPFNGHIYGLIGIGKLASENETAAIEKELAKRLGVTLNV